MRIFRAVFDMKGCGGERYRAKRLCSFGEMQNETVVQPPGLSRMLKNCGNLNAIWLQKSEKCVKMEVDKYLGGCYG